MITDNGSAEYWKWYNSLPRHERRRIDREQAKKVKKEIEAFERKTVRR